MVQQNTSQNTALQQFIIKTDLPLWHLLLQGGKKGHKFSKPEAFFDLVDRQLIANLKGGDNHLAGTIPELVKTWKWDRETVWNFLVALSQLGVLTIDNVANRKALRLNNFIVKEKPSTAPDVPAEGKTASSADNFLPRS